MYLMIYPDGSCRMESSEQIAVDELASGIGAEAYGLIGWRVELEDVLQQRAEQATEPKGGRTDVTRGTER